MSNNRFCYKRNSKTCLEMRDISNAICGAQMDFDNGAIAECKETLAEIVEALTCFLNQIDDN